MLIQDFKQQLENNICPQLPLILVCQDNKFVASQYSNKIASIANVTIDFINELPLDNIFEVKSNNLLIYNTDKLILHTLPSNNIIIWCSSIDASTKTKFSEYIVEIPKLEKWQIIDYAYSNLKGISKQLIDDLLIACNYDIYKLNNDIRKLKTLSITDFTFNLLNNSGQLHQVNSSVFAVSDALIKRDFSKLGEVLKTADDIEPLALVSILINNFKSVMDIQLGNNATAEKCGLTSKQFYVIKTYCCNKYSKDELIKIYQFLLDIDKQLKLGNLYLQRLVDYIIIYLNNL